MSQRNPWAAQTGWEWMRTSPAAGLWHWVCSQGGLIKIPVVGWWCQNVTFPSSRQQGRERRLVKSSLGGRAQGSCRQIAGLLPERLSPGMPCPPPSQELEESQGSSAAANLPCEASLVGPMMFKSMSQELGIPWGLGTGCTESLYQRAGDYLTSLGCTSKGFSL